MTSLAGQVGLVPRNGARTVRTGPWSSREFALIMAAQALAILLATVGWWYTSDEPRASEQIGWLNLSLAGVVVAVGANGLFLARGRQTIRLATNLVLAHPPQGYADPSLDGTHGRAESEGFATAAAGSPNGRLSSDRLVSVVGTLRYHRPNCALVTGKKVEHSTSEAFSGTGRHPCEVCEP